MFTSSTRGTLLVDRFVLDGMTNSLNQTLEVRYKRSRQRYKPIKAMKINSGGQMEAIDALDFRDMQNQPFYEPTTEIGPKLLNGLLDGWFGVVVNPTHEVDGYRWHFFVYNAQSQRIDTLTLHSGDEQIFTLRDNTSVSIDDLTNAVTYIRVPGIIQQKIALQDSQGQPLLLNNGLAAIKYDVQYEDQTATGPQLLRDASKVMLAVPTDAGIATLSFAIAVGDTQPAPSGTIVGMSRSTDESAAEQVRVQVADADQAVLAKLSRGDVIKLANTTSYNGLYQVESVTDRNAFTINAPFTYGEVGDWEKVETEDTGLIFDGMLTGYQKVGPGVLQVSAFNHGLEAGDWVQIVDSPDLAGEYPILTQDANSFTVQRLWVNGDAVNIKLESRKRRGLVFDGKGDWIEVPLSVPLTVTVGFAVEAWVKLNSAQNQTILATVPDAPYTQGGSSRGWQATLGVNNGKFSFAFLPLNLPDVASQQIESPTPVTLNQWVHVACALDDKVLRLLENGVTVATLPVATLDQAAQAAYTAWLTQVRAEVKQKEDDLATLQKTTPVDQAAVDRCKTELNDLQAERLHLLQQQQADERKSGSARQEQIESAYSDLSTRAHATATFARWQRDMENLQVRAGKRNIVNTYVWDGDGGLHVEEQQFASTVEHSIGGSFEMDLGIGSQMSLAFAKGLFEAKFMFHATLTQTMTKTEADSTGMELHVDLSGVESRGITDHNDYPLLPGEKVDRYRFMSFFLENNTDHWHDFFDEVVDPEWLNSNDEEARALRETRNARPNKVWRVLHRVTYVERPSLMGFGRQIPNTTSTVTSLQELRVQVKDLSGRLALLQNELSAKLDQILSKLPK